MITDMNCSCCGKNLDKFLQAHILLILSRRPMYGLEIINELEKMPMFSGRPDPTGVYRYLKKMEADSHLVSEMTAEHQGERPRKTYSITESGKICLANWAVALGQYSVDMIGLVSEIEDVLERRQ